MKIAYLSTFYPYRGGIAQFNAALYRAFEELLREDNSEGSTHQDNIIRAYNFSVQYPDILFPGSSQFVTEKDIADKIPSSRILNTVNPFSYVKAGGILKKMQPDIIINKFWMPFFAPSLGTVMKRNKASFRVCILDNAIPHEKRVGDIALTKYYFNSIDHFIVMSDKVKQDLLSLKPDANFTFYHHPLYDHFPKKIKQEEAIEKLGLPKDKKLLLFFGFIRDYKGLDLLIDAMNYLDDDYHLVIAGEIYGKFDKYDILIRDNQLENKVSKFVRYIDDDEVALFFSASDLCILPYKDATQSGITGISFHYDLPIVASDVGGLREVIGEEGTGLMIEDINAKGISNKIKEYFSLDKSSFIKSINQFKEKASWNGLAKTILELQQQSLITDKKK